MRCNVTFVLYRKAYSKRQAILHSYGDDLDKEGDESDSEVDGADPASLEPNVNDDVMVATASKDKKPCKCGSTSHRRISHKECPLNKAKKV